jgi:hypothetical protein
MWRIFRRKEDEVAEEWKKNPIMRSFIILIHQILLSSANQGGRDGRSM